MHSIDERLRAQGPSPEHERVDNENVHSHTNDGLTAPILTPIAIIGMACRLSGNVSSLDDFWEMMCRGRNGWSEIPETRFSKDVYWHPNPAKKGSFNSRGGYFLSHDPAMFDAPFFNITRAEAEAMGMFF